MRTWIRWGIRIHFFWLLISSLNWCLYYETYEKHEKSLSYNIFKMKGNRVSKNKNHYLLNLIKNGKNQTLTKKKMSVVLDQHIYFQSFLPKSVDYFKWTFNKKLTWSGAAPLIHSDIYLTSEWVLWSAVKNCLSVGAVMVFSLFLDES